MSTISQTFLTVCKIKDISQDECNQLWFKVWEVTITKLLYWIIEELNLTTEQLETLEIDLKNIIKNNQPYAFFSVCAENFNNLQNTEITQKYATILTEEFHNFYQSLEIQMTEEQKNLYLTFLKEQNE